MFGQAADALVDLTGGIAQRLDIKRLRLDADESRKEDCFKIILDAMTDGAIIHGRIDVSAKCEVQTCMSQLSKQHLCILQVFKFSCLYLTDFAIYQTQPMIFQSVWKSTMIDEVISPAPKKLSNFMVIFKCLREIVCDCLWKCITPMCMSTVYAQWNDIMYIYHRVLILCLVN